MIPARTTSCPTDLDLEAHLQVPELRVQAHVAACRRCTAWLAEAKAAGERFEREVAPYQLPRVIRALEQDERPRWFSRLRPFPLAGGLAAATVAVAGAVLLIPQLHTPAPPEPGVIVKGDGLQVFLRHGAVVKAAASGDEVSPGDALRFTVTPPGPRFVLVFSVDARGAISRLHEGDDPIALPTTLPGSAVLDAVPGPERIFAVFATTRLSWQEVERAVALALPRGGDAALRSLSRLPISGTEQATILLERRP